MTFHWAHNYGAILQAYALYHHLHRVLGLEVHLIDFATRRQQRVNTILPRIQWNRQLPRILGLFACVLLRYRPLNRRRRRFVQFVRERFACTRPYRSLAELCSSPPTFDAVITGSDQVFNGAILPEEELLAYCLAAFSSARTLKIAFAPSFGNNSVPSSVRDTMAPCLADFQRLSAREAEGAIALEAMSGRHVPTLLDPVFLLESDTWRTLARPVARTPAAYVLCYALNGRRALGDLAGRIKALTGLPIVLVTARVRSGIKADSTRHDAGPREFLWLLANARYVVTDSFHGTALAALFEKDFVAHISAPQGSQRIVGLLTLLGQKNRLVSRAEEITLENLPVDFTIGRQVIVEKRGQAILFLREALSLPHRPTEMAGLRSTSSAG